MSPDKLKRIWRTAYQAAGGLLLTILIPVILAATNQASIEFKDYTWWPILAAGLTALVAALQNIVEDKRDTKRDQD